MKTIFKTFASVGYGYGFHGEVALYLTGHGELLLYVGGKEVWSSSSLPSQAIDGTGWAEAAFNEPDRRQHFGTGSGGTGSTVIRGTSGGGYRDGSVLNNIKTHY